MTKIPNDNLIETEQWGLVWRKDYDNPEFNFLRRDKGIPYEDYEKTYWISGTVIDEFGNRKKGQVPITKKDVKIAPEYFKWEKLHRNRIYAQSVAGEAFKNLTDEELSQQELEVHPWQEIYD